FFGLELIPGHDLASSAALDPVRVTPLIGQQVFQRSEQKRAETSLLWTDLCQPRPGKQSRKKFLRDVFGLLWSASGAADKTVERIPISPKECPQRFRRVPR